MSGRPDGEPVQRRFGRSETPLLDPSDRAFYIGLVVVVLSLVSATATYAVLTGLTPIRPRGEIVVGTLFVNVVLIVAMVTTIAWQATGLVRAWRAKVPGARLHVRIVALFSVVAALPAILLAVAATTTFSRSLDGWFATRTRDIINASDEVARAYLDVHGQLINTDILNMARDIGEASQNGAIEKQALTQLLLAQTSLRGLLVTYLIDADGRMLASAFDADKLSFLRPPAAAIEKAEQGQVPLLDSSSTGRVYAIAKVPQLPGRYLYAAREVSPAVVSQIRRTQQNTEEYNRLRQVTKNLKIAHGLMYFMISVTALLAAIWAGLWFAARFVAPIRRLIEAAQEVSKGNLDIALPERRGEGDLRRLSSTFNKMTVDIRSQRNTLVTVNRELADRQSFMEAVLSGVSAGVIGLDGDGTVTLVSRSAETLLGRPAKSLVGKRLATEIPELAPVIETGAGQTASNKHKPAEQLALMIGSEERTFAVQVTRERSGKGDVGSVVTFDDVTDLVVAQRTSAWADVARRIAHEIKNPLTPIQLSAERIKRKYGSQITADKETFDKLTDTISRQVGDIKSMVDEFASFARMPQPQMERTNLKEAVLEPVLLFRESHGAIRFELATPEGKVDGLADRRLLGQAITNLVKNATEAIEQAAHAPDVPAGYKGRIEVRLTRGYDNAVFEVIDNGIGLPKQNRAKLLEPYVTTRAKGTGLGLAIVQKIVEQHKGTLTLEDAPPAPDRPRGALVRITLPMPPDDARAPAASAEPPPSPPVEGMTLAVAPEPVCAPTATAPAGPAPEIVTEQATEPAAEPAIDPATNPGADTAAQPSPKLPAKPTPTPTVPKAPSVSPTLLKNSDRVMPRPKGRIEGAR